MRSGPSLAPSRPFRQTHRESVVPKSGVTHVSSVHPFRPVNGLPAPYVRKGGNRSGTETMDNPLPQPGPETLIL